MAANLWDHFQQSANPIIVSALQHLQGRPPSILLDEPGYRKQVIDAAWNEVPLPLRMIGRKRLHWDELFLELRKEVFDIGSGTLRLVPDAPARIRYHILQQSKSSPEPSPAMPSTSPPPTIVSAPKLPKKSPPNENQAASFAVGIDLGTTFSVIAHLDDHGRPCSIPNTTGDILTPSVVLFDDAGTIVGKEAVLASALELEKVAVCVKRDMGLPAYRMKINGESLPPEVISSFILQSLKGDAERKLGPFRKAVITVPAYFDETRRRATMDAGRMAGLDVLDIINEPTAAAIAYGYQLGFLDPSGKAAAHRPIRILVYDLGGGTFDVTILQIHGTSFKALATDGDVNLGGRDWDEKLLDIAAQRFIQQYGEDPRDNPVSLQELWLAAEAAKKTLSERARATVFVNHRGKRFKVEITRQEFEDATAALLGRTRTTSEIVVRQAGITWSAIDKVLLVGGSTRMPMVVHMLQDLAGQMPERSISPDEAVAHGAALYADLILHERGVLKGPPPFSVTNINSHSLGIVGLEPTSGRRCNHILIPKNTPLPHSVTRVFQTHKPNQRSVAIKVVEGESKRPEVCTPVGTFSIRDLPPHLPQGWPVQVSYSYEPNGRLMVAARLKGQEQAVTTDFIRDNCLPEHDLNLWALLVTAEVVER
jgi:molecular chaperone DnaK